MREITETIYVAKDGTRFLYKSQCEKHEAEFEKAEAAFDALPKSTKYNAGDDYQLNPFACDDTLYCIPITSMDVVEKIKNWCQFNDTSGISAETMVSKSDIGKRISLSEYDGYFYRFGTPYELKRLFCDKIDELANIKCEVEGENA